MTHHVLARGNAGVSCVASFKTFGDAQDRADQLNQRTNLRCWVVSW